MYDGSRMDRRRFTRGLISGTGGLTLGLAASTSAVDDQTPGKAAEDNAVTKKTAVEPQPEPPAELFLLSYLIRSYPNKHLEQDALAKIYLDIAGDVARGQMLREFPLKNSDEPAFVFRAFAAPRP